MPLGPFEREVLRLLARQRSPDSYVGGATVLHQSPSSPRASADVDIFHDTAAAVHDAAQRDTQALLAAGYAVEIVTRQDAFCRAVVARGELSTKLEWVHDSAFRFFPIERDEELGWRLSFWDAATNKALAFSSRDKLRDWIDVVYIHEHHLHLGALVWAAAAKDPGLTPDSLLESARRLERFPGNPREWQALQMTPPADIPAFRKRFESTVREAMALVERLPPADMGCLYIDASGRPVCPDPASPGFPMLVRHFGSVRGAWPRIAGE